MKRMTLILSIAMAATIAAGRLHAFVAFWNNDQHLLIGEDMKVNDRDFPEGAALHEAIQDADELLGRHLRQQLRARPRHVQDRRLRRNHLREFSQ